MDRISTKALAREPAGREHLAIRFCEQTLRTLTTIIGEHLLASDTVILNDVGTLKKSATGFSFRAAGAVRANGPGKRARLTADVVDDN